MNQFSIKLLTNHHSDVALSLRKEIVLSWNFIYRDISSAIIPEILFIVAAWKSHSLSVLELVNGLVCGTIYFYLFLICFCISNQLAGFEEDKINKPDRPLVSGEVSLSGATWRWTVYMLALPVAGLFFGVLHWALLWQVCVVLYNFCHASRYWLTRNIVIAGATVAQLASAWKLMAPITSTAWQWILIAAATWLFLGAVQDLRDIEGDKAVDRKTLPIILGEDKTRVLLSLGFFLWPLIVNFSLFKTLSGTVNLVLWSVILAVTSWAIAWRIMVKRSAIQDHETYMTFTGLYCLVLLSANFLI